jgi:hypothetical protein
MCGGVVQASGPDLLGLRIVNSFEGRDRRGGNLPPRYNAAPSQELWAIRQHPETGERTLDLLKDRSARTPAAAGLIRQLVGAGEARGMQTRYGPRRAP